MAEDSEPKQVTTVRLPQSTLDKIDGQLTETESRAAWIREAVNQRLEKPTLEDRVDGLENDVRIIADFLEGNHLPDEHPGKLEMVGRLLPIAGDVDLEDIGRKDS